ncbi:hypothetical protein TRFO_03418 [Tritrichomonas foetus]|uniref:MSP domain-containing protein n=1 Tax=Tritrichomonas foetus TaxID=1144522 RepID=A0A1J4KQ35_9EUKA|nr:hypothetical protein TRFO_03418 [Tritrichomonas foetus]|eukprot:OHT13016.1 hypothetical protein TRFO_03418 [Tritrichomonas foetus]
MKGAKTLRLEPNTILFPQTFISSTSRFSLKINNDGDKTVHYKWVKFKSESAEKEALETFDIYNSKQRDEASFAADFRSDVFNITPMSGEVWPKKSQFVVIEFSPQIANDFKEDAYLLDITNNYRYHVIFQGQGLPPDATFNIDTINVGHVPLDTVCEYEVILSNDGKVNVDYEVIQSNKSDLKFDFIPSKAIIPVGSQQKIKVIFSAVCVGQFNETFTFHVRGAVNFHPSLIMYGKVVGPDFLVSTKFINFGDISYGFLYTQTFEIENKSDISFDYRIRLLQDSTFSPREFNIIPNGTSVPKFSKQLVTIEFVPITIQTYNLKLALDILRAGKELAIIPITANCHCPLLKLEKSELDYEHVYIGKEYSKQLVLMNDSEFPAKFEFIMPEETNVSQAHIIVSRPRGVIKGRQDFPIDILMTPQLLGPINITGFIKVFGSDSPPMKFTINATSTGPTIKLSTSSIHFGNIPVLKPATAKLTITNASLIPASFTISIQNDIRIFSCEPTCGDIEPNDSVVVKVVAKLDDTISFSDKIVLNFVNLNPLFVDLLATGTGSPIVSSIEMNDINFNYILNEQKSYLTFTITNYGRRPQELRWTQSKPKVDDKALMNFSFKILPESTVINPREKIEHHFVAFSPVPTNFLVNVMCNATLGRNRIELFQPTVHGTVIKPLLSFSQKEMEFIHKHDAKAEEEVSTRQQTPSIHLMPSQQRTMTVTNLVKLPLNIKIDTLAPFSVQPNQFVLEPHDKMELTVIFDAAFKQDFCSEILNRKLIFSFDNHPQHLYVNLKAVFIFPNLSFSPENDLNFGNLMLNTEQTKEVTITSTPDADVEYSWQLVTDDENCDLCRIFDVYPTRGQLTSGKSENIHFSFFAYGGEGGKSTKYSATAICHIVGGPDYVINLNGAAAAINYKLNPLKIDFGHTIYDTPINQQITLTNLSDVPIAFSAKIPRSNKFSHFSITPSDGSIPANGTQNLNVNIVCGLPIEYNEDFIIQIGHFEEIKIPIHVIGRFYQFSLSLPRHPSDLAFQAATSSTISSNISSTATSVSYIPSTGSLNEKFDEIERKVLIERLSDKLLSLTGPVIGRRRRNASNEVFQGFVLSQYLLDLKSITIGEVRSAEFELCSLTPFPMSFELKTNVLKGTGFSIEPHLATNIPPGSKVPMKVVFDTAQRTNNNIGDLEYDIQFQLTEELGFSIKLHAKLILPTLGFSKNHFDFEQVIVGQSKTMTLQLQNMNNVSCEYNFGEAIPILTNSRQFYNKNDKNENEGPIFIPDPPNGILPPASFQNVKITFIPPSGMNFSMQLPINIKHNTQPRYVTLSGTGVQLRIEFDPPSLNVPPVQPFSEPSKIEVQLINPTNYQIEVFSYHFDFDLFCQHFMKKEITSEVNNVTFNQTPAASKFSLAVIVHGPHMSGCSIAAKSLGMNLHVPVISLQDIWSELIENNGASADYTAAFFARISQPDCSDGFVVDSLHALKESNETDQFILSSFKSKNCYDDTIKNPFHVVSHSVPTAAENALNYILAALDGHYVFFVGVRTSLELVNERIEKIKNKERKKKHEEEIKEKNNLFNMTEEEYNKLTEEERKIVDKKRKSLRNKIMRKEATKEQTNSTPDKKESHGRRTSRKEEGRSSRHKRSKNEDKGEKREKSSRKEEKPKDKEPRKRRNQIPTDLNDYSIVLFNLTVGSIAAKLKENSENFTAIDPQTLKRKIVEFEEEEEEEQKDLSIQQVNSIVLKEECSIDDLRKIPSHFVPTLQKLKESAFTELIPPEKIEINKNLPVPLTKFEECPPFFSIEGDEVERELPDFEEDEINASKKNRGGSRGRGGAAKGKTRGGKKKGNNGSSTTGHINFDTNKLTGRWTIPPNSRVPIVVIFDPTVIGSYKNDLLFGISNCSCDVIKLPCFGVCNHPNISRDLKHIFNKRVPRADNKTERAFVADMNEFMFGPVLVTKDKLSKNATPMYNEVIHITNPSSFKANLSLFFADSKCPFVADPPQITIEPQATADIKIGVHPNIIDTFKNTLTLVVEDQPEPFFLNFSVESCIPILEPNTTNLDFDKLLLKQERKLNLELKNTSKLPAFYQLKNVQQVAPSIEFSSVEGIINPRGSCTIKAVFSSQKPINIKKQITLEVLDKQKSKIHNSIPINVVAEAFDVLFDFQYPPKMDHLQFGTLKVQQPKLLTCNLKNKGKFPINYKIAFDPNFFQISPSDGVLNPGEKPTPINFTFKASKVVSFVNTKGITLSLTDPVTNTTTAVLPIPFSGETMYSAFTIALSKQIDFGSVPISTVITKQLVFKNEGRFAFDFETSGTVDDPPQITNNNKNARLAKKAPPPPKPRGGKGKNVSILQIGNYSVSPSNGTLNPGQSVTIDIDFQSPLPGDFNSTLKFKVTDSNPHASNDQLSVKMHVKNIVPEIETHDFEKIFPGLNLCIRYDVTKTNRTAFLEDEQVLHFMPLLLQQHSSVNLALVNIQPVPCIIDMTIKPKGRANASFPFDLSEKTVTLEPFQTKKITLGFNPVTCDNFVGFFEGIVRGSTAETKQFKFTVEGVGALPQLSILSGMDKGKGGALISNLGLTLLGFTKEKYVIIANEGVLNSHVKIVQKPNPDFEFIDAEKFEEFDLCAGQRKQLQVIFKPQKPRKAELDLSITVQDNPKNNIQLSFLGEGSAEDIVFDGLNNEDGNLVFKDCIVGRQQTVVFSMRNVGSSDVRFLWSTQNDLVFSPHVGHLKVGHSKPVKVTFFSDHQIKAGQVKVVCQISKIELTEPHAPDWDDSMKIIKYVPRSSLNPDPGQQQSSPRQEKQSSTRIKKSGSGRRNLSSSAKPTTPPPSANDTPSVSCGQQEGGDSQQQDDLVRVTEIKEEPAYTVVPGKPKDMPLKANIVADFIKYQIDTTEITFSPTMMYQTRTNEIKLTNNCLIRFDYTWHISHLVCLRTNYAQTHGAPFSVEPVTGFIEPGQTKTFKVNFEPEEVDDFTADLVCDVPFLTQMEPPIIKVSGLSRRPLCHFNVDLSDYLSAGRRHPDYTNPLPEDIRVIELFSKGIGERTSKRLELINPTSSPYEVRWNYVGEGPTPIFCDSPSSLVSSGKKQTMVFGYLPVSVKTIESLWEFHIPEHNVRVPFLFVGRIMPK